ncbi:MAG: hypothetical protein IPH20_00055 [Bacteroidales bacterium]|nr:hypothetical protein [Bacteroidales bacterium]
MDAGTYAEYVTVSKSLDIRGPNYGISPNTASEEARIVIPPTTNTTTGYLFLCHCFHVTIDGFVDGDNPTLTPSGVGLGGSDDAYNAIYANANGLTNVKVKNNIVTNLCGNGIRLQQATNFFATTSGATYL